MSPERGKKATIGGMKKPFKDEETSRPVHNTHTEFKAQDGPFMMMGTG